MEMGREGQWMGRQVRREITGVRMRMEQEQLNTEDSGGEGVEKL